MISSGPNSFSILLRRKLELPENFLGSSNLCTPGQIDLKAKIGFQNSLAQIEFTEGCAPGQIEFVLKAKMKAKVDPRSRLVGTFALELRSPTHGWGPNGTSFPELSLGHNNTDAPLPDPRGNITAASSPFDYYRPVTDPAQGPQRLTTGCDAVRPTAATHLQWRSHLHIYSGDQDMHDLFGVQQPQKKVV